MISKSKLAGIEYCGIAGSSQDCKNAVMRLIQYGSRISTAKILSCSNRHSLLLTNEVGDITAIKSGFTSGYSGEGPHALSFVLELLHLHSVSMEEFEVKEGILERLDNSALTHSDLELIHQARPILPTRLYEYILNNDWPIKKGGSLWRQFDPIIPLAIVDTRIIDLALGFLDDPDKNLLAGYRRLEDVIRERTGLKEHGAKLFSQAFLGNAPKLTWKNIAEGEQEARGTLFSSGYRVHRNPRAHRELRDHLDDQLSEFLLLNHLFRLEAEAIVWPLA